jgi:hypothetical protein
MKSLQRDFAIFWGASPVLVAISCRVMALVSFWSRSMISRSILFSSVLVFFGLVFSIVARSISYNGVMDLKALLKYF